MRKICVVVASRANYGRVKYVLKAIEAHPDLELQLVVSASVLLDRYGRAIRVIEQDGFKPLRKVYYVVEGENLEAQAKSTGLGIIELSGVFEDLKPDVVITVADRYETMATAIAASYLNIPLAHIQGGEITGNIDELVRHAITKLSHYHFPATEESKQRLLKMGEEPWRVVNSGCPAMDTLCHQNLDITPEFLAQIPEFVGHEFDFTKPYILVLQHPVTTTPEEGRRQIEETLYALVDRPEQKLVMWPNIDAGSDMVSRGIRVFRDKHQDCNYAYHKNFSPEIYNCVLNNAVCCVGNSSSFIREASFLGTPTVVVGDRQEGREHGHNVTFCDYDRNQIAQCVEKQIAHGRYEKQEIFGTGRAGEIIADYLANVELSIHKRMTY
ncbi:MAG: UDP-N-acetylglucosamine 2-epimerase [Lachnospiraceae bacterium]|nr:UDP-N-acetylglucosamine 2-epimerase [Lachnospiraceae bacterium]